MQENEFEKQLKEMMEGFEPKPSDAVWEKVRRKLNDRNRKMLPFFFLLFSGLLVAGYFLHTASKQESKITGTTENAKKENNTGKISTDSIKDSNKIIPQENTTVQTENSAANTNQKSNNAKVYTLPVHKKEDKLKSIDQNVTAKKDNTIPQKKQPLQPITLTSQMQSPAQFHDDKTNNITMQNAPVHQDTSSTNNTIAINQPSKSIQQNLTKNNNSDKNIIQQDSTNSKQHVVEASQTTKTKKPVIINNKIPNWQIGVTVLYGKSNLIESIIDLNKSYSPSGLNNGDTLSFSNSPAKKTYSSFEAYNIGGVIEKKLFKNGMINIGLNYTHLSVKSKTAQQINSAFYVQYDNGNLFTVPSYYNPGSVLNHKSTYNFIELPVNFQQDIFHKNKIALSYNTGLSLRQLLNSKSLIYDRYSNVYYANNSLLNKTQFQFLAGLNLNVKTGNKSSFFIGPQFSYSLSNLTKNTNNSNFHFITYGLQAGILFHKK